MGRKITDIFTVLSARPTARADVRGGFHIDAVRNEVVGEQTGGAPETTRTTADVYVFEGIGGWGGVTAEDFVSDVAGLDVDHIDLHLNSPGGAAFEGVAIANVLRQHRADVTVWVDGIAASAASVIAMAGDEVVMGLGAQLMIHDAAMITFGNAAELAKDAEMVGKLSDSIAATYAAKAGGTAADWRAVMQAETWYTAEEAVTAGLADRVATDDDKGGAGGEQVVPGSRRDSFWDLWDSLSDPGRHTNTLRALYAHAGRAEAPAPRFPGGSDRSRALPQALSVAYDVGDRVQVAIDPPHAEGQSTGTVAEIGSTAYGVVFDAMPEMGVHRWYVASELAPEGGSPAADMPGMSAPQTPAASASGSTHKERSTPVPFTDEQLATLRTTLGLAADASEDKIVSTVAEVMTEFVKEPDTPKAALPKGTVAVDQQVWEQTRADAAAGRKALSQQQADRRERLVNDAVLDGRIAPARHDAWLAQLEADPGAEAVLAGLAKGLIPLDEIGHARNDANTDTDTDALYKAVFGDEQKVG